MYTLVSRRHGLAAIAATLGLALALVLGTQLGTSPAAGAVYVASLESDSVSAFSVGSGGSLSAIAGSPFATGRQPLGVAVSPDGRHVYVTNLARESVSAFAVAPDGSLSAVAGSPFATGYGPWAVAVSLDGKHVYVANNNRGSVSGSVSAFSVASDGSLSAVAGSPFSTGAEEPVAVAVSPDGKHLYVSNQASGKVSAFSIAADGSLSPVAGSPFATSDPQGMAVSPNAKYLYVANGGSQNVSAFAIAANGSLSAVAGSPFATGATVVGVAITLDGRYLYLANQSNPYGVSGFSIASDGSLSAVAGSPFVIPAHGAGPNGVAASRDDKHVYLTNYSSNNIWAFSISPNGSLGRVAGSPVTTGEGPLGVAVGPDLSPVAAFSATVEPAGSASSLDASASTDPDGAVTSYGWEFGDGQTQITPTATTTHTYAVAGDYTVTLTATNEAGCSTTQISSGQTVICNGSPMAQVSHQVTVPTAARLSVSLAGSGSGTLMSSPLGIVCPETCSHTYATGTQVTLVATPASGSTFAGWSGGGWSGGGCSGIGGCQVTMSSDLAVTATFETLRPATVEKLPPATLEMPPPGGHTLPSGSQAAATGSVSLAGSDISIQSSGKVSVKLMCAGTATCTGKLTLTVKGTAKKGKKTKAETIGTAAFSIPAGKTATVTLTLIAAGLALLKTDHGKLSASITILKSSPSPTSTQHKRIQLVQKTATKAKKRKK